MPIRAAVVDDEPLARRRIRNVLAEAPDVDVIAECANGKEPIDGCDVLQAIGAGRVPAVIFVTRRMWHVVGPA